MTIQWKTCFKVGISVFLLYLCIQFWPKVLDVISTVIGAASPLLIGCVIAYLVNILMSFYEKHYFKKAQKPAFEKSRRPVCMLLAFITLLAIIVLVIGLVIPQLVDCINTIFAALPGAIETIIRYLGKLEFMPDDIISFLSGIDWKSGINQIFNVLTSGITNVVSAVFSVVSSVFSAIVTGFLALIFAIYLLTGKDRLKAQIIRLMDHYLSKPLENRFMYALDILDDCFHRYIVGQCTEAVILGVLCTLGMWILRLPYATMIGALIAFTALIPVAGAYIGGGVGALMIFSVEPVQALVFLIFLVILQQLEGNLVYPKVVGSSLGLPAIWVLAAVTIGGGIMGVLGMLLGVPVAAAVYRIIRNDMLKKDALKNAEAPEEDEPKNHRER